MAFKKVYLLVKLENDSGVDDHDIAKLNNQMPCHLCSCILGHSKRLMNNVNQEVVGFYSNNIYYGVPLPPNNIIVGFWFLKGKFKT